MDQQAPFISTVMGKRNLAIPFSKIKPTVLGPQDFIGIGKLAGKRVADAAISDPEYLLWAHKEKVLVLSSISLVLVNASKRRLDAARNYNTNINPYLLQTDRDARSAAVAQYKNRVAINGGIYNTDTGIVEFDDVPF